MKRKMLTVMRKFAAVMVSVFLLTAAVGCSGTSDDGGVSRDSGGDAQSALDDVVNRQDVSDYEEFLQDASSGVDSIYQSYKEVYRNCSSKINDSVLRFNDLFDAEFFNSDAAAYQLYMTYYASFCSVFEDIFSGDEEEIEQDLKSGFSVDDVEWSVDGGSATITFESMDSEDVTVTVEYDGSSTAEIIYTADGQVKQRASFITNESYSIIAYRYDTLTVINAAYANGEDYYIYAPGGSAMDFSVYQGSFDDPSTLIGDRSYVAIVDGALVY